MRVWSGTSRRLLFAFGVIMLTYAAGSVFVLGDVREMRGAMHRMSERLEEMRLALELESAVRDQYAHQAHTIILGDATHVPLYAEAQQRVRQLTAALRASAQGRDDDADLDGIDACSDDLDHIFRDRIVPAVLARLEADVQEEHGQAQLRVTQIEGHTRRLVDRRESAIRSATVHVNALEHRAFTSTLLFLLVGPALAIVVGEYVRRSIARPLDVLHDGAARLAAGDLDVRIEVSTADEFGALARQFNAMTTALREHQAKLVQAEKLAGIGRLAAGVAHEINNPLGVILGYTRLLENRVDASAAADLAIVRDETLRCKDIVEGLLDLSRPLRGPAQEIDLRELCDGVVERLREARALDGVNVEIGGSASTLGDPQKLRQIVLNLVKNAVEAAGDGGRVDVQLTQADGLVTVSVADSGPGIDPRSRERIFEPFFTTKPKGTGLGLAVSQGIAQAHGGRIEVADAPAGGALFTVRLLAARKVER